MVVITGQVIYEVCSTLTDQVFEVDCKHAHMRGTCYAGCSAIRRTAAGEEEEEFCSLHVTILFYSSVV